MSYRSVGVKWYGEGVHIHEKREGQEFEADRFEIRSSDLIYNDMWARKGSVAIVPDEMSGCVASSHFPTFELDTTRVVPKYLSWFFRTPAFWQACEEASRGSTGRNQIKRRTFLAIGAPLPSLREQHRIVARIEEIAERVRNARALRQSAAAQASALMICQASRLFDLLEHFPRGALRSLGVRGTNPVQTGPFGAQLHASDFVETGVPVLNVGNVWPEGLRLDRLDHVLPEKAVQLSRYTVEPGDLLFARSGATLGKVCLVPNGCTGWLMTGHLFRVRFDASRVFNEFAFAAMRSAQSIREQVFGQVRGATRPGFNTTLLGNVEFPIPPLPEQRALVSRLNALQIQIDALRHCQSSSALELDALMPAILDRAFRGEL